MAIPETLPKEDFHFLTWTRDNLSQMAIQPETLRLHCPLGNGRLQSQDEHPSLPCTHLSRLGRLNMLPLEITHLALGFLDLHSLTCFKGVSPAARASIDNFTPYRSLIQHAPDAVRVLLSTHTVTVFIAQEIYGALCRQSCSWCVTVRAIS